MGVVSVVHRVAINTSTGLQTITTSKLGGLTPKAAICRIVRATVDDTVTVNEAYCEGATDGTAMFCASDMDEHNVGTTVAKSVLYDDKIIGLLDPGAVATEVEADLSSGGGLIADGITINITKQTNSTAFLMIWEFYAGSDVSAHVNARRDVSSSVVGVTDVGFAFELCQFWTAGGNAALGTITANARMTYGIKDGTVERCLTQRSTDAASTTQVTMLMATDGVLHRMGVSSSSGHITITNVDSSGFDLDPDGTNFSAFPIAYLALSFGGVAGVKILDITAPASTGNDAITGFGFEPAFAKIALTRNSGALGTVVTDNTGSAFAIGAFDDTDEFTGQASHRDNVGTSDTYVVSDAAAVHLTNAIGDTLNSQAAFVSFDTDGYTLNHTTAIGTAYKWFVVGVEGVAEAPAGANHRPLTLLGVG